MRKRIGNIPARPRPGFKAAVKERVEQQSKRAHEHQLAFELWMGPGGRNMARTHKIIAAEPYNVAVSYASLAGWRRSQMWDIKADELQAAMSPALHGRFQGLAEAAAVAWMGRLLAVAHGESGLGSGEASAAKLAVEAAGWMPRAADARQPTIRLAMQPSGVIALTEEARKELSSGLVDLLDLGD